jgi:uncharacterized protein (UPF0333 family)
MWKLIKLIIVVLIVGGIIYYIMDYNKKEENSIINSTKEFGKDAIKKVQKKSEDFLEEAQKLTDSTEVLKTARAKIKE